MKFCNINISDLTKENLFKIEQNTQVLIPMNAECFVRSNKDIYLLNIVNTYRTTIDGQIPFWLYRKRYKGSKVNKISGSDIIYDYCKWAETKNLKVFFLGGTEDANFEAIKKIRELYSNINITGYSPPYEPYPFSKSNNDVILAKIREFHPNILFVAFGFGKQERWIDLCITELMSIGINWVIACGGSFEFVSGKFRRAPVLIQKIGLEGLWRLIIEPKWYRFKRLLISLHIFKYL